MSELPLWITGGAIWAYWLGVLIMVTRQRLAGRGSGLMPRQRPERWMWLIWVPTVGLWIALPALGLTQDDRPWAMPAWADAGVWLVVRWLAGIDAAACFAFTVVCWVRMGRSWAMANVPGETAELVTLGPFRWVRHPIYALSIMLIVDTWIVLPTWPMLAVAAAHITLMHLKAASEERFLLEKHGESYARYMRETGRFLPKIW